MIGRTLAIVIILFTAGNIKSQAFDTAWTKTYGGGRDDLGYCVRQVSDGGFIFVGSTRSFSVDPGYEDVYLVRTDVNGGTAWAKTYGGVDDDIGLSVQQTGDEGFIISGWTRPDSGSYAKLYLIRTNSTGDTLWTKTYGKDSLSIAGSSVKVTGDGGFVIAGTAQKTDGSNSDVILVRTDSNGDTLWTKTFGGAEYDWGNSIDITDDKGFIIAGRTKSSGAGKEDFYLIRTDSIGDTLWTKTYGGAEADFGFSAQQTSDGGFIVAGRTFSYGVNIDAYLVRTNSSGDTLWTRIYGGDSWDECRSVQQTSDGGFVLAGATNSYTCTREDSSNVFIIRTDSNGDTLWTKNYGGKEEEHAYSVQQTSDSGFIVGGRTNSFGVGNGDFYLLRLTTATSIEEDNIALFEKKDGFAVYYSGNKIIINYVVTHASHIKIEAYDIKGKLVKIIKDKFMTNGAHTAKWDIKGNNKEFVSGMYFIKLTADDYTTSKKITILR